MFQSRNVQNMFSSLSAFDFVCFAIFARYITNPHAGHKVSYEMHAFGCFGNSSIAHTEMACKLGREAVLPNEDSGGNLRGRVVFRIFFILFSPSMAPRDVYREAAFTTMITV